MEILVLCWREKGDLRILKGEPKVESQWPRSPNALLQTLLRDTTQCLSPTSFPWWKLSNFYIRRCHIFCLGFAFELQGLRILWFESGQNEVKGQKTSLMAQPVRSLPAMQETWVRSLGWEDPLKKEMATHSSTPAWKIPWTEEPDRLQFMGSQTVRHNWATWLQFKMKCISNCQVNETFLSKQLQVPRIYRCSCSPPPDPLVLLINNHAYRSRSCSNHTEARK